MYDTRERIQGYLQFVFPQNVTVQDKAPDPLFFSFMMTDSGGFNSFFHVLTFYEEVNEQEIQKEDFDIIVKIWHKQQEKEAAKRKAQNEATKQQKNLEKEVVTPGQEKISLTSNNTDTIVTPGGDGDTPGAAHTPMFQS